LCSAAVALSAFAADQPHKGPATRDTRIAVDFPDGIKQAMLERMRRNLSDVHEIQKALAESDFERAADVAEFSLGLSSLGPHNARQAPYMPPEMQRLGTEMHAASSRVARAAQEADPMKALGALSQVTGLCVSCHAVYRAK
jgi:cytochrome c556